MSQQTGIREFWRRRQLANILLLPLAGIYWLGWCVKRWRARRAQLSLPVPVIIAGGLTAGGGGKTTLTQALVAGLRHHDLVPGVIARGYGSQETAPRLVQTTSSPQDVGDEPALLARQLQVPVAVGVDRVAAARCLLEHHPEVNVIVSDDGLQHLRLPREFEIIVLTDYQLGNGWLLPAGPLREPARRLHHVDAIVRKGTPAGTNEFSLQLGPPQLFNAEGKPVAAAELAGQCVCALAGIAEPNEFFATVISAGIEANQTKVFADHHAYQPEELAQIKADWLVMTAKDAIKCKDFNDPRIIELRCQATLDEALLIQIVNRVNRFQPV